MKRLETPRLILRPFDLNDLPAFYAYARKPNIGPSAGWKPHESLDESLQILKKLMTEDCVWAITRKNDGKLLGSIGLHPDRHRKNPAALSLGYVLDDVYWGQGLTVEAARRVIRYAFEELGLALVSVTHYPDNVRSKRVIEKCHFEYEATIRQATVRYDGKVFDDVMYLITKEQYDKAKHSFDE